MFLKKQLIKNMKRRRGELSLAAIGRDLHFQIASTELSKASLPAVKDIADLLLENPHFRIRVIGHTDDLGGAAFNKSLSLERAKAVKEALLRHGGREADRN